MKTEDRIQGAVARVTNACPALAAANAEVDIDHEWADGVDDARLFFAVHHQLTQAMPAAA